MKLSVTVMVLLLSFATRVATAMAVELEAEADYSTEYSFDMDLESELSQDPDSNAQVLIVSPLLGRKSLGSSITIYELDGQYYLPLFTVTRLLEFGIQPVSGGMAASGFIISEDRPFRLDLAKQVVTFGDKTQQVDAANAQRRVDDIYVAVDTLSLWFPIDFEVNTFRSSLTIKPREKTPRERRMEREERLQNLPSGNRQRFLPRLSNGYRLIDGPFIDETVTFRASSPSQPVPYIGHSSYLAADLLYLETNAYLTGTESKFYDYRINVGRKDPYARLLGPLGAREFAGIDIASPGSPLLFSNRMVRGGLVSSYPLGSEGNVMSRDFRGDLPPGWTVELYRGDFLLDYRQADLTGQYLFERIPIEYGHNRFRLVFYGPYGQTREEVYDHNLADAIPEPGNIYYHISGGQDDFEQNRALAKFDLGVAPFLGIHGGFAHSTLRTAESQYAMAGLRSYLGPVFATGDFLHSTVGGNALALAAQTRVNQLNLTASHDYLTPGFRSELYQASSYPLLDRTTLATDTYFTDIAVPIGVGLSGGRERYRGNRLIYRVANRTSISVLQSSISHRLEWRRLLPDDITNTSGRLAVSRGLQFGRRFMVIMDFDYMLRPSLFAQQAGIRTTTFLPDRFLVSAGVNRHFQGRTSWETGLAKDFRHVGTQITARYTHPNEAEVFTSLTMGLGYESVQKQVYMDARPLGREGSLLVRAFLDSNQNGAWDASEKPVPDVIVYLDGVSTPFKTAGNGMVLVPHISPARPVDVSVSASKVDDPSLAPSFRGASVVARPGRVLDIYVPFFLSGEIEGTVFMQQSGDPVERGGVPVELIDANNRVVATEWSAYDGFYLFTKVPPGKYSVRISSGFLNGWELESTEHSTQINEQETLASGLDFVLKPR